ncbi:hypothetical protein [Nocardia asteroides]|uniref:hypothetical protein n=1 Tax=Nocardia asteroides TaxID=1824 RepID=UPI0036606764
MTDPSTDQTPVTDDVFLRPANALPLPPQPDAVLTADAGTATRLAHQSALLALTRPVTVIAFALVTIGLVWLSLGRGLWIPAASAVAVGSAGPVAVFLVTRRRLRRGFARLYGPGARAATRIGPDSMDIVDAGCYLRLPYENIEAIAEVGAFTVVRTKTRGPLVLPSELFPGAITERLPTLVANRLDPLPGCPDPLPPLPTLPFPQATVIADDSTARDLHRAVLREPWTRIPLVVSVAVFAVTVVALTGWVVGPRWAALEVVACALLGLVSFYAAHNPPAEDTASLTHAAPGAVLAAQFGSDAVALQTCSDLMLVRYAAIRRIDIRGAVATVRMTARGPLFVPEGLFPQPVRARLRHLGVRVTAERSPSPRESAVVPSAADEGDAAGPGGAECRTAE